MVKKKRVMRLTPNLRKARVPEVPDIPEMFAPKIAHSMSPKKSLFARRDALEWSRFMSVYERGEKVFLRKNTKIARMHGCKLCPYWNSTSCYHSLPLGEVHKNGICEERLSEVVEYVRMGLTFSGKEAKRNEVVHKVANHIIVLERNLSDYRARKMKDIMDERGVVVASDLERKEIMYDAYEMKIMGQVQMLADKYAGYMGEDLALELKAGRERGPRDVTPMDVGLALKRANRALLEGPEGEVVEKEEPEEDAV